MGMTTNHLKILAVLHRGGHLVVIGCTALTWKGPGPVASQWQPPQANRVVLMLIVR